VSEAVSIPVIAHGGANSLINIVDTIKYGKADALAIASILHYKVIEEFSVLFSDYIEEGNISFLNSGKLPKNITLNSIEEIKSFLLKEQIATRY